MSRRPRTPALSLVLYLFLCYGVLRAVVINDFHWSASATAGDLNTASNWVDGMVPPNDSTADLFFGDSTRTNLTLSASLAVNSLTFESFEKPYLVGSTSAGAFTLGIHSDGITVNAVDYDGHYEPTKVEFSAGLPLQLLAAQTWNVNNGSVLRVHGVISGAGGSKLGFDGDSVEGVGEIQLLGNNTYAGGTDINSGLIFHLGSNTAFGTGLITINADAITFGSAGGDLTLANAIDFNTYGSFRYDGSKGSLTIGGAITLYEDLNLHLNGSKLLTLSGNIGGGRTLYFNGSYISYGTNGTVLLQGINSYSGGTIGNSGSLIFASAASLPAAGSLRANSYAYLGLAATTFPTSLQVDFIDRFDKANTSGAIGFDTDPAQGSPNNFAGAIDLTGFHPDARLGSATRAILSGVITPQGTEYRFGMGGGVLEVASNLTGANSVRAFSEYESGIRPLLVRLTGTNTYSGGTTAATAALIFGTPAALPATGSLTLGYLGYIGLQLAADVPPTGSTTIPDFLNRFGTPDNIQSTVGFDSADALTPRVIYAPVDFTGLTSFNNSSFSLGTSTNVTLAGTITMPHGYRFVAYRGGQLTVQSNLTGANTVGIGSYVPVSDPQSGLFSTVTLSGDNSYTGITGLRAGRLLVGQGNSGIGTNPTTALGTNTLQVEGFTLDDDQPSTRLEVVHAGTIIANPVHLYSSGLALGGANSFTLSGLITGDYNYRLSKYGAGTLTLSGSNTFSGGIDIGEGNVTFTQNNSAGTGHLQLALSGASATFTSSAPSIGGLSGNGAVTLAPGSTLTINTNYNIKNVFGGILSGSGAGLIIDYYSDRLAFTGANTYSGGTTITDGTLRLGDGGTTGSIVGNVTVSNYDSTLAFNRSDAVTYAGVVSGSGNLQQDGPGPLTLTGANIYTGVTSVHGGTLILGAANAVPATAGLMVDSGATFDLGGFSATVAGLSGEGNVTLGAGTLTTNSNSYSTFSGIISGTGGFTKTGSGILFLEGDNTFTGVTTITDGELYIGNGDTKGSLAGNVINNATLIFNRGDTYTYGGVISGTGIVSNNGYGTVTLTGANTYSDGTFIYNGTLVAAHDTALGTGGIYVGGGSTLVVADGAALANPVSLAAYGTLAGHGFIDTATIDIDTILSPGSLVFSPIGSLDLNHLELNTGGSYDWQIQDPNSTEGHDLVNVGIDPEANTLVLNASAGGKFTLKIISLDLSGYNGDLVGIDPGHGLYTWTLFNYDALQTTLVDDVFDPDAFLLDLSLFTTTAGVSVTQADFSLFDTGNSIVLGFTPVPEPSTYVLLGMGLLLVALAARRPVAPSPRRVRQGLRR